jgi:hypothetical protein
MLPEQPLAPPLPAALLGTALSIPPRSPPSIALYGSFKAAAATRAAAAFDGGKAVKSTREAPARPALAHWPLPAPGEPGARAGTVQQSTQRARQSKLS